MTKFKVGDVVTCVNDSSLFLITKGNDYTVEAAYGDYIDIWCNDGSLGGYHSYRFELVQSFESVKREATVKPDPVNQPPHYTSGKIECIDYIESCLGREQFIGWLRGNIIKYQHRYQLKGKPVEDLGKINFYLDRLKLVESNTNG